MIFKKNRIYIFDWDDNIMSMPTTILIEKFNNAIWVEDEVDTQTWANIRHKNNFRASTKVGDPFIHFDKDDDFIIDLSKAIENKTYGPSYHKFKEALLYGHDFAIVTARGHSRESMINGILMLIIKTFSTNEYIQFINSVGDVTKYLNKQEYWTVSSKQFESHFKEVTSEYPTELRKTMALKDYIKRKIKDVKEIDLMVKLSIGFSDDDKKNIKAVKKLKEDFKKEYPKVHFVVYDTSNPNKIKKTPIK